MCRLSKSSPWKPGQQSPNEQEPEVPPAEWRLKPSKKIYLPEPLVLNEHKYSTSTYGTRSLRLAKMLRFLALG